MSVEEGPTIRRRRLGAELKRCREAAGLTQEQVSREFEWHAAKVTRIEAARVAVTARDVKDLLLLYGVDDPEYRDSLMQLARSGGQRGWWSEYRDILPADAFIRLEADASLIRDWEPVLVPGLLQTEAYVRALFSVPRLGRRGSVDRFVSLRLARQRRLTDDPPLVVQAVIDESVIHRRIGGAGVMADQLRHLVALSQRENVDLRVLPYDAGEHPLLSISAVILEFHDAPDLDVVYLEHYRGTHTLLKRKADVAQFQDDLREVTAKCLDQRQTRELIESVLALRGGSRS
ncbi:helix-turn-helix domain-containing protein [Actinoplanes sp. NPDC000266]